MAGEIEGPLISLDFEIPSLDVVDKMSRFFAKDSLRKKAANGSPTRADSLRIGGNERTPVSLVRDDEYDDRFFLVIGQPDDAMVQFIIAGKDVSEIADALRQVRRDLDDEA